MTTFGRLESVSKPRELISSIPGCTARLDASLYRSLASEEQMDALVRDHARYGDELREEHITRWGFDPAICAWIGCRALFRDGVSVCFDSIRRLRHASAYGRRIDPGRMTGCSVAFSFVHMDRWLVEAYLTSVTRMSNIRKCGFHLWSRTGGFYEFTR